VIDWNLNPFPARFEHTTLEPAHYSAVGTLSSIHWNFNLPRGRPNRLNILAPPRGKSGSVSLVSCSVQLGRLVEAVESRFISDSDPSKRLVEASELEWFADYHFVDVLLSRLFSWIRTVCDVVEYILKSW
jgi:hypothetical protein